MTIPGGAPETSQNPSRLVVVPPLTAEEEGASLIVFLVDQQLNFD